jgi:hypothetical protein
VGIALERKAMLAVMSRSTQVIGRMLEGITARREIATKQAAWITHFGQIFWGLVSVAVPGSLAGMFLAHWVKLLYLVELGLGVLLGLGVAWRLVGRPG